MFLESSPDGRIVLGFAAVYCNGFVAVVVPDDAARRRYIGEGGARNLGSLIAGAETGGEESWNREGAVTYNEHANEKKPTCAFSRMLLWLSPPSLSSNPSSSGRFARLISSSELTLSSSANASAKLKLGDGKKGDEMIREESGEDRNGVEEADGGETRSKGEGGNELAEMRGVEVKMGEAIALLIFGDGGVKGNL